MHCIQKEWVAVEINYPRDSLFKWPHPCSHPWWLCWPFITNKLSWKCRRRVTSPRPPKWNVVPRCVDILETCQKCRADIWQKHVIQTCQTTCRRRHLERHLVFLTWTTCRQYVVKDILMTCHQNVMSLICHWWHFDDMSSKCHVNNKSLKIFWQHVIKMSSVK
jgi:hypothetical protein